MNPARALSGSNGPVRNGWNSTNLKKDGGKDTVQSLRKEAQAKQVVISKLTAERDAFKKRIIDLKAELNQVKQ